MSTHFKYHEGVEEIVPPEAKYSFPNQANRSWKQLIKLPPVNGSVFSADAQQNIQINFPAQSYLDAGASYLQFDLEIKGTTAHNCRVQNDIQTIFKRVRGNYGSLNFEDINEYNTLVRFLTETCGTNLTLFPDQTSILEGKGALSMINAVETGVTTTESRYTETCNTRLYQCQIYETGSTGLTTTYPAKEPASGVVGWDALTLSSGTKGVVNGKRRYCVKLALGLLLQGKLIPLKWMASQLSLQLQLAPAKEVLCTSCPLLGGEAPSTDVTYELSNVAYYAQLIDFDGAYDSAFLDGLRGPGVPIKFASWSQYYSNAGGSSKATFNYPERNRSIKCAFCVQNPPPAFETTEHNAFDSHAFVQSSDAAQTNFLRDGYSDGHVKQFQWRVGGKLYPAQPVMCTTDGSTSNGAAEAYAELEKALNLVGDGRMSTSLNATRWCNIYSGDVKSNLLDWAGIDKSNSTYGHHAWDGPSCFAMAADFETSNGQEVSGINGEEQQDIALMVEWSKNQNTNFNFKTFIFYDAMIILKENNVVELVK